MSDNTTEEPEHSGAHLGQVHLKLRRLRERKAGVPAEAGGNPALPGPRQPPAGDPRLAGLRRRLSAQDRFRRVAAPPPPGDPARLDELVPGIEVAASDGCAGWVVSGEVARREPAWANLGEKLAERCARAGDDPVLRPFAVESGLAAGGLLFVDLETTGLGCSPLFLIGVMSLTGDGLQVRQYFARHYGEERAVILLFLEELRQCGLLVTFNGRSFDWPYVKMRAAASLVAVEHEPAHLDVLLEARRVWRPTVPDCRLQTLEQHICGRPPRTGDIPGEQIPEAYHEFVSTGDARQMAAVLEHNFLDLVTLADLLVRLPGDCLSVLRPSQGEP